MNADKTSKCIYLFEFLKKKGVRYLEVSFDGSGDDGQMSWGTIGYKDKISPEYASNEIWEKKTIFCYGGGSSGGCDEGNMTVGELVINDISEYVVNFYDIDYMNNEGNSGNIVFNVETGEISTSYRVYETKTEKLYI